MVSKISSAGIVFFLIMMLVGSAVGAPINAEGAEALNYRDLGITHGAYLRPVFFSVEPDSLGPEDYGYGKEILNFDNLVGKDIDIVMYFAEWNHMPGDHAFDKFLHTLINYEITDPNRRPAVMITWEPTRSPTGLFPGYDTAFGCTQAYTGVIPPADIINGNCDAYLITFANDLKARPERFLLRFAHEMNIDDSPWWPGNWVNDANLYVEMYRHVHDVIMGIPEPPTNVEWVWSPNYASNPPVPWNDIHNYYPGDKWVDWIGLSGYNWFTSSSSSQPWRSFEFLYDEVLTDLTCRYAKPQIIAEIGTVEGGGSVPTKADWISDVYLDSPNYPFLRAIVWFNDYAPNGADFRVTTSSREVNAPDSVDPLPPATGVWTNAYSTAIANTMYNSTLPSLSAATPPHPVCTELFLPIITR